MDSETAASAEPPVQVVFRGKKRKAYRQRTDAQDGIEGGGHGDASPATPVDSQRDTPVPGNPPSSSATVTTTTVPSHGDIAGEAPAQGATGSEIHTAAAAAEEEEESGLSVAEVLRRRNARKSSLGGVRFSATDSGAAPSAETVGEGDTDELSLMIREEENRVMERPSTVTAGVNKRFAPQTGLSGELINRHIDETNGAREEYIEAELAKKHLLSGAQSLPSAYLGRGTSAYSGAPHASSSSQKQQRQQDEEDEDRSSDDEVAAKIFAKYADKLTNTKQLPEKHTALQGKLLEVDLGDEVRSRNAAMTDRARRRLLGESVEEEEEQRNGRPAKVRLGRDGKPWRPRNRRGSDDVKRDQLVEEILRENRHFDVYETPVPPTGAAPGAAGSSAADAEADEGAADDRIAEEFRREFMEAMAQRRQRRKKAPVPPSKQKKETEEILRGPKLGGSRNARAAMRDILLKQQEEKKAQGKLPPPRSGRR